VSRKVLEAMNEQMNFELYSGYIYLSMASYFESESLRGFAHWMKVQFEEEKGHAMRFYSYLLERGFKPVFESIPRPKESWSSPLDAFEDALEHERKVTSRIWALVDLARSEGDKASERFLDWFVNEQVEEEAGVQLVVDLLKKVEDNVGGLLYLDSELGKRER